MVNPLGDYLRARRAQVDPTSVGIVVSGVRRTPGLRREEVATLAGISADYYLRLEQGRDRNPSPQVLESLARVLRLDATATAYLLGLPSASGRQRRTAPRTQQRVPVGVLQLLGSLTLPAFVESRTFDVLAANPLATALYPSIVPGANRLRSTFLDPDDRARNPRWERDVADMVAGLRVSLGPEVADPAFVTLVGELSLASQHFRELWARHDVRPLAGGLLELEHPDVGRLELRREKLAIGDSGGQLLVIYHAEPGSETARSLRLLGSLSAVELG
ncbi:helix-turn-helix transcriptional regulator [Nocardioides sp. BP30]|uniref:helix-turn-helix domain-containing protein n=1 Tax=Nocardioides sp. BP30 TaxID=3036374 RepID=UPI0024685A2E|nr:helix-turn-helix transcriptional regulator [Nocardioides sp. BP30]WGL53049.1 helix-turn-helix transcriptional regulator [Nocardioides sp. BP30]